MQRDKRGRFIKKAQEGTTLTLNGKKYKVNLDEARKAHETYLNTLQGKFTEEDEVFEKWLPLHGTQYLTEIQESPASINTPTIGFNSELYGFTPTIKPLEMPKLELPWEKEKEVNPVIQNLGLQNGVGSKIKYNATADGKFLTEDGKEISIFDITNNKDLYELNEVDPGEGPESAGMTLFRKGKNNNADSSKSFNKPIDKTRLADFLELTRTGIGASVNNKIAERALAAEKPFLQDVSESHRSIYGDYRAQVQGEKAAAQLRKAASQPLTSDGALQSQMMMEAQIKGQEYIDQGNAQDEAMIKQTREVAWQQEKENQQQRQAAAMQNRQAMLMSEKNKAQIRNMRDSANFSQVISPILAGREQRLRNKAAQQEYYQDYYDDAMVTSEVWRTYNEGLTESQKAMRDVYINQGLTGLQKYIGTDTTRQSDYTQLQQIMNNEILRRKAALKGAYINPSILSTTGTTAPEGMDWRSDTMNFKKGGTVYKARLTKRTKDNDRGSKSIESSKKIAARFLEQAIDSLYDYNDVELIAKPGKKRKRKYQAGGGLPFVNVAPVFATSETGAPKTTAETKSSKKGEDLTTKDILELLKDIDGLPSDIDAIQATLSDFIIADKMDPLGLASSSDIASRYVSLIGRIKKAKANRDWYDKAYDKLRNDNALNEYAVDSTGHFIGMDQEGEFARFTAKQVADGEVGAYTLLTNSNLLDIRARYPNAAFNSNLIIEAANGISMEKITEHISKTIQGLGSDKTQTQVFGNQSKEVLAGLRQLQQAAQEVGQDLSISDLYEANVFNENQAKQAQMALSYLYQTLPTNMKALLFAKAGSQEGALGLINTLVNSKLSSTNKLEFSPKNKKGTTSSSKKSGIATIEGIDLSPAQMLQQGYGEREEVLIQDQTSTGLKINAITMPVTTGSNGQPLGAATLEDVATSQYGGLLNFTNASMGGQIIPFEGRRNIAVDGSKIYSMYLPVDQAEYSATGNIVPDIALIDKVNKANKEIKEQNITDINEINAKYTEMGLPVYLNQDGTVSPTAYRRFGVLNGTAIDNAFGKNFIENRYLKKIDDDDLINGAIQIMNKGRSEDDRIEYDSESFFNFGGLLGDYDSVYQGTIFIPMSNDAFLGVAGSGKNLTTEEAEWLDAKQQQHQRVSATYKNPGQLR